MPWSQRRVNPTSHLGNSVKLLSSAEWAMPQPSEKLGVRTTKSRYEKSESASWLFNEFCRFPPRKVGGENAKETHRHSARRDRQEIEFNPKVLRRGSPAFAIPATKVRASAETCDIASWTLEPGTLGILLRSWPGTKRSLSLIDRTSVGVALIDLVARVS